MGFLTLDSESPILPNGLVRKTGGEQVEEQQEGGEQVEEQQEGEQEQQEE